MDRLIYDLIFAVISLVIVSGLYFIGKFSKKIFKNWSTQAKQFYANISIFSVIVLAFINSYAPKVIADIALVFAIGLVVFIILVSTSISSDKKK